MCTHVAYIKIITPINNNYGASIWRSVFRFCTFAVSDRMHDPCREGSPICIQAKSMRLRLCNPVYRLKSLPSWRVVDSERYYAHCYEYMLL